MLCGFLQSIEVERMSEQLFGGGWTEEKLRILKHYLNAYTTALKKQPFTKVYIDVFAGTGYRQQRKRLYDLPSLFKDTEQEESEEFLKGSAILALEASPAFDKYIFVESDPGKVGELKKLQQQHPRVSDSIEVFEGDANKFIPSYCAKENWENTRAVMFLDPFATQVDWQSIVAVAQTKSIDIWILFPLMAVNRLLARDAERAFFESLTRIFGTDQWFQAFYQKQRVQDIFGKPMEVVAKACNFETIGQFYQKRLRTIFGAGVADTTKVLCNSHGSPLFQLFFAAGNPKGAPIAVRIANYLLGKL